MDTLSEMFAKLDTWDGPKLAPKPAPPAPFAFSGNGLEVPSETPTTAPALTVDTPQDEAGRLGTALEARQFILGGKAIFTLVSTKTKARFTFKVSRPADGDGSFFFVSVLNGPDNWANYQYFGYIRNGVFHHGGAKARCGFDAPSVKAFSWTWMQLARGNLPDTLQIWHMGHCGRCARPLTVPESIRSGFGPECITKI